MKLLKTVCLAIAASSIIAIAPAAYANSGNGGFSSLGGGTSAGYIHYPVPGSTSESTDVKPSYVLIGGSATASRYFRQGVKNFEKGNLEKSEYAFEASLRAHGSKIMDGLTFKYLTLINDQQGDEIKKEKYEQALLDLSNK